MTMKNKAAVALGRRGGKAKKAKLTAEQRKEATAKARAKLAENRAANSNFTPPPKIYNLKVPAFFPTAKLQPVTYISNTSPTLRHLSLSRLLLN
jgi:hypothetical protein